MTWRISRFEGTWIALAASVARATSSRLTSRLCPETATTPRLFWLLMWLPPTATKAELIL
jgi:hypothetical protein